MESPLLDVTATTAQKIATAKQKKDLADQAYKAGISKDNVTATTTQATAKQKGGIADQDYKQALKFYHEALMYLLGLDKNALQSVGMAPNPGPNKDGKPQEKTEIDDLVGKIYSNMSACHLMLRNWERARETADKALAKNEDNYKAMFRKGKALGEQFFFEKALKVLEDLKSKNPSDKKLADQEIERLRVIDNEREKANKQKMKGFLNKAEKKGNTLSVPDEELPEVKPAFIEELKE